MEKQSTSLFQTDKKNLVDAIFVKIKILVEAPSNMLYRKKI